MDDQSERDLSQPPMVVESHREGFSLMQSRQATRIITERAEGRAQGEAEINGLLPGVALLRQMREGAERVLEVAHGLAIGRLHYGLLPRLSAIHQGLVPHLALGEMVRQLRVVLFQPVRIEVLDGLPHSPVQVLAALHQETLVGDILDHRVLEDVGGLRHEPLLVDDLQGLQLAQQPFKSLAQSGDTRQQPHQELPPDHRGHLHRAFAVVPKAVQGGHNDPLDGVRDMHLVKIFHESVGPILPLEDPQIKQSLSHLLDEQGHALGFVHQSGLEFDGKLRCAEDMACHGQCLGLGETMERQRRRKAATPKWWGVANTVGHQEQQRDASHRIQHGIEELFTAGVDPVQVFDHQYQGAQPCATERQRP
jgi:hypothetical protein